MHSYPLRLCAAALLLLCASPAVPHSPTNADIARLSALIAASPHDAALRFSRGELYRTQHRWEQALADYRAARGLDPRLDAAVLATGLVELARGNAGTALTHLDGFAARHPDHGGGHLARARTLVALGRPLDAARAYDRSLALAAPPQPEHYIERARALAAAGSEHTSEALAGLEVGLVRLSRPVSLELAALDLEVAAGDTDAAAARKARLARAPQLAAPEPLAAMQAEQATGGAGEETVLVQKGSPMRYRANTSDPGGGVAWTAEVFAETGWTSGIYGVGYETAPPGATHLIQTAATTNAASIYTRASFYLPSAADVTSLSLGVDYDDGYIAWINGVQVFRSAQMPAGAPAWNTPATAHESSNAAIPVYTPVQNISVLGLPALHDGVNTIAIGVWNTVGVSSDLVVVPKLRANVASGATVTRGPYLQLGTPTGMVVRWRTDIPTDSRVRYGTTPENLTLQVDDAAFVTDHVVALTGLSPATRYYYSVGSTTARLAGATSLHFFATSPPAGTATPQRIWVLGDSGTANANARAVRDGYAAAAAGRPTDLWLMLGDNAYSSGTDAQYQIGVFDMYPSELASAVLWPTLGNHDGVSADSATQSGPYYDIFTLPAAAQAGGVVSGTEAYYSFNVANIHFVCLESYETDRSAGGAMMTWLSQDLAATTADWTIAYFHHPPYSRGSHDSDVDLEMREMRQIALPVLEAGGVDLVLTGHSHSYERSYFIDGHYGNAATFVEAHKKEPGNGNPAVDGPYDKATLGPAANEGAVHAVAGSSGQISGGPLDHPAMLVKLNMLGSMVLDINGGRLDARFIGTTGAQLDTFTIMKGDPAPRPVPDGRWVAGTAARASKLDAAGSQLALTWDVSGCGTSTNYSVLWGAASGLAAYTLTGAACNVGTSGTRTWSAPTVPAGEPFVWWVIAGTDGAAEESSWGRDSTGAERKPASASGLCGASVKDTSITCP